MAPTEPLTIRGWSRYVLKLVLQADPGAEVCLQEDEWVVETSGPPRELMGIRVVNPL